MIPSSPVWSEFKIRSYPALPCKTVRADVAIIGAGFTGLSAAYHLLKADPTQTVVVLEAGRLGAGASGHTTGILGPGVGRSLWSLVDRYGPETARALYRATIDAVNSVRALITSEAIDCQLEMTGQIVVARSPSGRRRLETQGKLMDRLSLPYQLLGDADLDRVIRLGRSHERVDRGAAALRISDAGILHPIRLLAGLATRVTGMGGQIFEGARVSRIKENSPVQVQFADGSEVIARRVVVATAGYTPDLGLLRGRILPVHLQVVVTEPMDDESRQAIGWTGREGVVDSKRIFNYFRLTEDDCIVFGGGRPRYRWGGNTEEDVAGAAVSLDELAKEMHRTFPLAPKLQVARGWTGVIGYVLDALPAIHLGGAKGAILHLVGWSGHGVALAVASGAWLTSLVMEASGREKLPWFRENPPLVPFELLRYLGFGSTIKAMSLLDAVA